VRPSESIAAAVYISRLPTSEARAAALALVPADFRDLVRNTVITMRAPALHWRKKIAAGFPVANVPEKVLHSLADLFPAEFPRP
jgi:hypothetical protein